MSHPKKKREILPGDDLTVTGTLKHSRPGPIRDPQVKQRIIEALQKGWSVNAACGAGGVSRGSFDAICRDDPEYAADFEIARLQGHATHAHRLDAHVGAQSKTASVQLGLMKALYPRDYREASTVALSGEDGAPPVRVETAESREALVARAEALLAVLRGGR